MRKNKIIFVVLFLIVGVCCTGCNGSVTRDIRHAGFKMSGQIECSTFFPKKKDVTPEKIKFMSGSHIINSEGKIYELSLSQSFATGDNCKAADTAILVKAILDDKIIKGIDNKYYYMIGENDVSSYSEVPTTDNSYAIYDLVLKGEDVVKAVTADSSSGIYYILKTDGNVYSYEITKADHNSPPAITSIATIYDKSVYGSDIIDFNYAGQESLSTYVRTNDKVFRMRVSNSDQCRKYADVACQYSMQEDPIFTEKKDKIVAYDGTTLITDYRQVFMVES